MQDKFGRGVPVTVHKNVKNPRAVRVMHSQRYNLTLSDACAARRTRCSHLCLLLPNGQSACACPNGQSFGDAERTVCNAAQEQPKAQPLVCKCQNGGICVENPGTQLISKNTYSHQLFCAESIQVLAKKMRDKAVLAF